MQELGPIAPYEEPPHKNSHMDPEKLDFIFTEKLPMYVHFIISECFFEDLICRTPFELKMETALAKFSVPNHVRELAEIGYKDDSTAANRLSSEIRRNLEVLGLRNYCKIIQIIGAFECTGF